MTLECDVRTVTEVLQYFPNPGCIFVFKYVYISTTYICYSYSHTIRYLLFPQNSYDLLFTTAITILFDVVSIV